MIKVNIQTTDVSGRSVASGSVITFSTNFITAQREVVNDKMTYVHKVRYTLYTYPSLASYKNVDNVNDSPIVGVKEYPSVYIKTLTTDEWNTLKTSNMAFVLAETWLMNYIEEQPGIGDGNCQLIDPEA